MYCCCYITSSLLSTQELLSEVLETGAGIGAELARQVVTDHCQLALLAVQVKIKTIYCSRPEKSSVSFAAVMNHRLFAPKLSLILSWRSHNSPQIGIPQCEMTKYGHLSHKWFSHCKSTFRSACYS